MNIVITGASRGIGKELAYKLSGNSHKLILVARSSDKLQYVSKRCNEIAGEEIAYPIELDLNMVLEDASHFIDRLEAITDRLDVLVNNAGILINKPFEALSVDDFEKTFDINVYAPARIIQSCLPMLSKSSNASIINITSMGAVQGSQKFPGLAAYSASKGALAILTECLAEELKPYDIRVNALALGAVQTEMLAEAFPGFTADTSPLEMARFIQWFVEEGSRRFNGKMLPVTTGTP